MIISFHGPITVIISAAFAFIFIPLNTLVFSIRDTVVFLRVKRE
jgi:hypothetical protein